MFKGIIAVAAVGSVSLFAATASSVDEAFIKGKRGGELSAMGQYSSEDVSFLYGHANLYFTTASFYNIRADVGLSGVGVWWKDDSLAPLDDKSSMHTANIGYFSDQFSIAAGRQKFDLVLAPYHYQAAYGELKITPQAKILLAYIKSMALPEYDAGGQYRDYAEVNDDDGAYMLDASLKAGDIVVNPYILFAPDAAWWFGGKFELNQLRSNSGFGLTGQLAFSVEDDDTGVDDGLFVELQADLQFNSDLGAFAGFALTGSDGMGSIGRMGKQTHKQGANQRANMMNPFWDGGCQLFLEEAKTLYAGAEFTRDKLWAGAMLGVTDADGDTYAEIDLRGEFAITSAFKAEAALVMGKYGSDFVDGPSKPVSETQVRLGVRYIF
ncbi:MAG: Opr family porin [Helicobacteraceae bacterium]|jgi:hypothetical protein|nr:Opr family porin [Helicobacteraceae bacterium]